MARSFFRLKIDIWDSDFTELSPREQWLYWLLCSHKALSLCGLLPLQPRKWASKADGIDAEWVIEGLSDLRSKRYVIVDDDTEELLIRTFIRHDEGWRNPKLRKGIQSAIDRIESPRLAEIAQTVLDDALLTLADGKDQVEGQSNGDMNGNRTPIEGECEGECDSTYSLQPSNRSLPTPPTDDYKGHPQEPVDYSQWAERRKLA